MTISKHLSSHIYCLSSDLTRRHVTYTFETVPKNILKMSDLLLYKARVRLEAMTVEYGEN
jgi:hypothetical protein